MTAKKKLPIGVQSFRKIREFEGRVFVFEFKVVELEPEGRALEQILARRYAEKYQDLGRPIHLIGVEFSRRERNLCAFEVRSLALPAGDAAPPAS